MTTPKDTAERSGTTVCSPFAVSQFDDSDSRNADWSRGFRFGLRVKGLTVFAHIVAVMFFFFSMTVMVFDYRARGEIGIIASCAIVALVIGLMATLAYIYENEL